MSQPKSAYTAIIKHNDPWWSGWVATSGPWLPASTC